MTLPDPPRPPTSVCGRRPDLCEANPGASGLGIDEELRLIGELEALPPDDFYDLALDADEIDRRGLDFLNWGNDGCSSSPDGVGGTSFLGPCARHDFSYRNLEAWAAYTGEDIFSQEARRRADDRLKSGLHEVCGWECDFAAPIYWVAVHGYGDGGPIPIVMGPWNTNPLPWDGFLPWL